MKKILSLVLALALLLSAMVFAMPASADELTELHTYETTARELETWNIQLSQAAQDLNVLCNLIDGLLTNDNHGNLVPNAAKEYTTTDGGETWTFKLNEGMTWFDKDGNYKADVVANDWVVGLEWVLNYAKNDSYKGLTPAKNSTVQVKYFADSSNLKMAVQQGQVDVAYRSLTPTDIDDLSKDSKVKVVKGPGGEERFLVFNFNIQPYGTKSDEPNADKAKAVRQAVANLIDREELATKVYKDTYTPMYSYIPDGLVGHEDTFKTAYGDGNGKPSADKAKKVLEDAGVSTPVELKLQYNPDHYGSSSADEYAALKAQLEEGGLFKVDLQSTEWTQYNKDRVVTEDSDGSYPVYQLGWFPDYSDPDNYLSPFFRDGNFVNNAYSNSEINDLIMEQAGETDESAREDLLKKIQTLETEDLSTIPLLQGAQVAVTGANVKGVVLDASFRFRFASVTKA